VKPIPHTPAPAPRRSVTWTTERIGALATTEVRQLLVNAERLNDPEIAARCNGVLHERRRRSAAEARGKIGKARSGGAT
jgi:HEAT repeat protein